MRKTVTAVGLAVALAGLLVGSVLLIMRGEPAVSVVPTTTAHATPSPARTPTPPADLTRLESGEALLQLVNAVRCEAGLTPVALSEPLSEAAYRHSTDMALNAFFDHAGSDGSDVGTRAADAGYSWRAVGENIAAGVADARTVHALWMDSPHHRDNILNGRYTAMGVGHVLAPDTEYGHYWTQVFGTTGEEPGTCEQ